jgi:hypothetical protein
MKKANAIVTNKRRELAQASPAVVNRAEKLMAKCVGC